jgi:hypothetical protein
MADKSPLWISGALAIAAAMAVVKSDTDQKMTIASRNSHRSCFKKLLPHFKSVTPAPEVGRDTLQKRSILTISKHCCGDEAD